MVARWRQQTKQPVTEPHISLFLHLLVVTCFRQQRGSQGHLDLAEALKDVSRRATAAPRPLCQRRPQHVGPPRRVLTSYGANNMWMAWTMGSL